MTWALNFEGVTATQKLVLIAMASYASGGHGDLEVWPSNTTLESQLRLSRRAVIQAQTALQKAGAITRTGLRKGRARVTVLHTTSVTPDHTTEDVVLPSCTRSVNDVRAYGTCKEGKRRRDSRRPAQRVLTNGNGDRVPGEFGDD